MEISVGEWPIKIVEPTTTRAPTNAVVETTVSVTDFSTEEPTTTGTTSTTVTPTVVIPKTTSTTTASSASSVFNSKSNDFDRVTTAEPKSLPSSTETNDYHFRKITPAKKFKFAQKYRRQPRLKIRKPSPFSVPLHICSVISYFVMLQPFSTWLNLQCNSLLILSITNTKFYLLTAWLLFFNFFKMTKDFYEAIKHHLDVVRLLYLSLNR